MQKRKRLKQRIALLMALLLLCTLGISPNYGLTSKADDMVEESTEETTEESVEEVIIEEQEVDIVGLGTEPEETTEEPTDNTSHKPYMIGADGTIYEEELPEQWKWIVDTSNDEIIEEYEITKQEMVDSLLGYTRDANGVATKTEEPELQMGQIDVPMLMNTAKDNIHITKTITFSSPTKNGVTFNNGTVGIYWSGGANPSYPKCYPCDIASHSLMNLNKTYYGVSSNFTFYCSNVVEQLTNAGFERIYTNLDGICLKHATEAQLNSLLPNLNLQAGDVIVMYNCTSPSTSRTGNHNLKGSCGHVLVAGTNGWDNSGGKNSNQAYINGVQYLSGSVAGGGNGANYDFLGSVAEYSGSSAGSGGAYVEIYRKPSIAYITVTKALSSTTNKSKIPNGTRCDFLVEYSTSENGTYTRYGYINAYWNSSTQTWTYGYRKNSTDISGGAGSYSADKATLYFNTNEWARVSEVRIVEPVTKSADWDTLTGYNNYFKADGSYNISNRMTRDTSVKKVQLTSANLSGDTYNFTFTNGFDDASLKIKKKSSNPAITNGNNCYDLTGAEYTVYTNEACTTIAKAYKADGTTENAVLTTDANGDSNTVVLEIGTYWVKETVAPKGYAKDNVAHKVVLTKANETTAYLLELDELWSGDPIVIAVQKKDSAYNIPVVGAEYTIKYYGGDYANGVDPATLGKTPTRYWVFKTKADGTINFRTDNKISGSDFYISSDGFRTIPLGTVTIQETKEPEGYFIDNTVYVQKITETGQHLENVNTFNTAQTENTPKKQAFQLIKLGETDTDQTIPLKSAGFKACNVKDLSKDANNNYIWDDSKAVKLNPNGTNANFDDDTVELFTDENGYALSAELPLGTYLVRETTVPNNYIRIADFTVTISEDNRTPQAIRYFTDKIIKAYLKIEKLDKDTNALILESNENVKFKIWSYKDSKYVSFKVFDGKIMRYIDEFTIDDKGSVTTPDTLISGKYRIEEYSTLDNYYQEKKVATWDLDLDNTLVYEDFLDELGNEMPFPSYTYKVSNTPYYGEIEIEKLGEFYEEDGSDWIKKDILLENIDFGIYANENIYTQDGQKTLLYAKDELVETITTDADGKASSSVALPIGKYYLKEENTPSDYVQIDNYEFEISTTNPDATVVETDLGDTHTYKIRLEDTLINYKKIDLSTTATDKNTGIKNTNAREEAVIVDEVEANNLLIGKTYTVKGVLMDKATKEPLLVNGKKVTAEKTFVATKGHDIITLEFSFDASALKGTTTVVFERLYEGENEVAVHTDIDDDDQTVDFPEIKTSLTDDENSEHHSAAIGTVKLTDVVEYSGLIPDKTYKMTAILMDKSTNKPILINNLPISKTVEFTPTDANGTVEVHFEIDGELLKGKTIVCFESCTYEGKEVAFHTDIDNDNQTVDFPEIKTEALDDETGTHEAIFKNEEIHFTDYCTYTNLVIGKKYKITGKIYDTVTGEAIKDIEGNEVTSSVEFTATKKNGVIEVPFSFVVEKAGFNFVTFEDLYELPTDRHIATHSDLTDKDQTLGVDCYGKLHITKTDSFNGKKLSGVEFALYKSKDTVFDSKNDTLYRMNWSALSEEDKAYYNTFKSDEEDLFIGKYVTDGNGEINTDKLNSGEYYIVEVKTRRGYFALVETYDFTIDVNDKVVDLEIENEGKIGKLSVKGKTFGKNGWGGVTTPRTGDNTKILFAVIGMISAILGFFLVRKKKAKHLLTLAIVGTMAMAFSNVSYAKEDTNIEETITVSTENVDDCYAPEKYITENGYKYKLEDFELVPNYEKATHLFYYDESDYRLDEPEHKDKVPYTYTIKGVNGEDIVYDVELEYTKTEVYAEGYGIPVTFDGTITGTDCAYLQIGEKVVENPENLNDFDQDTKNTLFALAGANINNFRNISFAWNGNEYTDAEGYVCRNYVIKAMSYGRVYRTYYEGDFDDLITDYTCEATYKIDDEAYFNSLTEEETTEEVTTELELEEVPKEGKKKSFLETTTGKVVLGTAVVVGIVFLIALVIYLLKGGRKATDYRSRRDSLNDYNELNKK